MLSWLSFASGDRAGVLPACESEKVDDGQSGDHLEWNDGGTLELYSRQFRRGASVN